MCLGQLREQVLLTLSQLRGLAQRQPSRLAGREAAIVTEKDAVKLRPDRIGMTSVWVAALDFEPEPGYGDALRRRLPPPPRHRD